MAKSIRPVIGSIAIVLLGYGVVAAAAPGDPLGPAFAIHPPADSRQDNPDVAASGDGFVVAWHGELPGTNATVHARRFTANGTPVAPFPDIEVAAPVGLNRSTAAAANANGQFAVLWSNRDQSPATIVEESVRSFAANGAPLGPPRNLQGPGFSETVSAVEAGMSASGNFVAVFQLGVTGALVSRIFARRFAFDGSPIDSQAFPVGYRIPGRQYEPRIAVRSDGSFVISWTNQARIRFTNPNRLFSFLNLRFYSARVQSFSVDAQPQRRPVAVDKGFERYIGDTEVATIDGGGFAVTWARGTRSNEPVLIRPYSAAGYPLRLRQPVYDAEADSLRYGDVTDIAVADDGSFYAVVGDQYVDHPAISGQAGFLRLFDERGEPLTPIIDFGPGGSASVSPRVVGPAVAILSNGNVVVSWQLELQTVGAPPDNSSNIMVRLFDGP